MNGNPLSVSKLSHINHGSIITFVYKNKKGEVANRCVEVGKADQSMIEGFDMIKNEVRRFLRSGIGPVIKIWGSSHDS